MKIDSPRITSFQPPARTLMGPGPSDVSSRVLAAMARPTIGHLDPTFVGMMDELKSLLRYAFQTENELTFPVSAPGSVGMETCFVNLVSPGDKVVVCINGVFGQRMAENVRRCGGVPVIVEDPWGAPVDPAKVEEAFAANPDAALFAFVHAETSTGALSDAATLAAIARRHGALTIMDCVTSLGGVPVLHTRAVASEFFRCGRGTHSCPQDTLPQLVPGSQSGARLLEWCQAHLPSHCAGQSAFRSARVPGHAGRGRP